MTPQVPHHFYVALALVQEATRAMEEAQRMRQEFLARMSHELRTPLNAVIGFSRVLEKNSAGNQRPEDLRLISRMRASGELLLRLVEDVLDQSTIERGQLSLSIGDTDVVKIASRVANQYRSPAAAKGLRLLAVLPETGAPVRLDAARFEQVLRHLLDNAIKFTPSGTVKVTVVVDADTGRPSRIIVSDSGIGIPTDRLDKVFAPFEQVDGSIRRQSGGAGLGLALARELCDAMGCALALESQINKGSRFTIRFPPAAAPATAL
jgi:signal transduction histidine kinase